MPIQCFWFYAMLLFQATRFRPKVASKSRLEDCSEVTAILGRGQDCSVCYITHQHKPSTRGIGLTSGTSPPVISMLSHDEIEQYIGPVVLLKVCCCLLDADATNVKRHLEPFDVLLR